MQCWEGWEDKKACRKVHYHLKINVHGESNCRENKRRTEINSHSFDVEIKYKRKAMMVIKSII